MIIILFNVMAERYCRLLPNTEDKTEISNTYIRLDNKWTKAALA